MHNKVIYWHVRPRADLQQGFAILSSEEFTGKHSGERIAAKFVSVLECWGRSKLMFHTVMHGNAANMIKAFCDAEIPSVDCTLHTLQLAIHDCILDQRAVSDALAACRRLVGHFKHSSATSHRLTELQKELHCDVLHPIQDVSTRWNSTYRDVKNVFFIMFLFLFFFGGHYCQQSTRVFTIYI